MKKPKDTVKPTDLMWVITADQINVIKKNMGPLPYDKVEPTLEVLGDLKPLSDYLEAEKTPVPVA